MNFIKRNKKVVTGLLVLTLFVSAGEYAIASMPKNVELTVDNNVKKIETSAKTVEELLKEQGYELSNLQLIDTKLDNKVNNNNKIAINTKKEIIFNNEGQKLSVDTFSNNVEEFLTENGVKPDADDYVSPAKDAKVTDGDQITYNNVIVESYKRTEEIPFSNQNKYDFNLNFNESKIVTAGVNGKKELTFEKITVNGKTVSDEKKGEKIVKEPINQVKHWGTKSVVTEKISFETEKRTNANAYVGTTKTIQEGKLGSKTITYKIEGKNKQIVEEKVTSQPVKKIIEVGTKKKPAAVSSSAKYTLRQFRFNGVIHWRGHKFTYYSQSVLPGGGLRIPGRHVNAGGFVADKDGYIVLANNGPLGRVISTPFGAPGKVYDRCSNCTLNWYDVYVK